MSKFCKEQKFKADIKCSFKENATNATGLLDIFFTELYNKMIIHFNHFEKKPDIINENKMNLTPDKQNQEVYLKHITKPSSLVDEVFHKKWTLSQRSSNHFQFFVQNKILRG